MVIIYSTSWCPSCVSAKRLLESKLRYSGKTGILEMSQEKSFQIDTYNDLELIKKLL